MCTDVNENKSEEWRVYTPQLEKTTNKKKKKNIYSKQSPKTNKCSSDKTVFSFCAPASGCVLRIKEKSRLFTPSFKSHSAALSSIAAT